MALEFIEIPDFDFTAFYYPDFIRSLTIYNRQNVPEITDESDEEPYTQLTRAFALVGHLNNVLLDTVAVETLMPSARLLESVRSHLKLIDVTLEQAKPAAAEVVFELSALFTTATNLVPKGTQVATKETADSAQITYEANTDNIINPTNVINGVFSFDPAYVEFLSNNFHVGDKITVEGIDFVPAVGFTIGSTLEQTVTNFVNAINLSTDDAIENKIFAYRIGTRAVLIPLDYNLTSITVTVNDNTLETTLVNETANGVDAPINGLLHRIADDYTPLLDRTVKNVSFDLRNIGTAVGNVKCIIEEDASGTPSGVVVAESTNMIDITALAATYSTYQFDFGNDAKLTANEKYWFVLQYDSPVGITAPVAEKTNITFNDGVNLAVAEVADVKINNLPAYFDVIGAAKHWLLDAQDGSLFYVWYNVTDGSNLQTNGLQEITDINFTGLNGASFDVVGNGKYFLMKSGGNAVSYYVWFKVTDGANVQANPSPGGTGIRIDILTADSDAQIAAKVSAQIDLYSQFLVSYSLAIVEVITLNEGVTTDASDFNTGAVVTVTQHGTASLVSGRTGIQVDILSTDGYIQIAQKSASVINALADFNAVLQGIDTCRVTQANAGSVTDPVDINAGVTFTIQTIGVSLSNDYDVIGTAKHWLLEAQDGSEFYVWYNVTDGSNVQTDPAIIGKTGFQINILKADTTTTIANKTALILNPNPYFIASNVNNILTVEQAFIGDTDDIVDVNANITITIVDIGVDENRVLVDSSGVGSSKYFNGTTWSNNITTLVMLIIADTTNFDERSGSFGLNSAGLAVTPNAPFPLNDLPTVPGSMLYLSHSSVMWDAMNIILQTVGTGINGVWEYYDGNVEDTIPDSVTNLGQNLEFDVTGLMGELDRTGAIVNITYTGTGISEKVGVIFEDGINKVRTVGLLGQITVSTNASLYLIGTEWNEVSQLSDETQDFTQNGVIGFDLPQNRTQNWTKATINAVDGYQLRYRVINLEEVNQQPVLDIIDITEGKQYLIFGVTQGESQVDDPLGSSNGSANQTFDLSLTPLIVESLIVEVDDGTGFSEYSRKDNFLTSTQISKDYTLDVAADDTATITFGDGRNGKKPAAGVDNIRAKYKIFGNGIADNGNVGSGTITVNKSGIAFISRVFNPRSATGFRVKEGSTDADLARLKIAGPASLRVRDRAITPDDYEFLATEYTNELGVNIISRALAIEETYGIKTIELVCVGSGGDPLTGIQLTDISTYFNGSKPLGIKGKGLSNHEATAVNYIPRVINVIVEVTGGNKAQIENKLKSILNPEAKFSDGVTFRWDFESTVPRAILISEIINVDPANIKNVNLIQPLTDIVLQPKELPLAGTITISIIN